MSVSYIRKCPCGLNYVVEEFDSSYVTRVDGTVEQDCPKCDRPLLPGEPLTDVPALVEE